MGREVRKVPADWQHPQDASGRPIPLFDGAEFQKQVAEWDEEHAKYAEGLIRSFPEDWEAKPADAPATYEEWNGKRPSPEDYMPVWPEGQATHVMMYENTSEGTPLSPAFATAEELARWLADNGTNYFGRQTTDYDTWLAVITRDFAKHGWLLEKRDAAT